MRSLQWDGENRMIDLKGNVAVPVDAPALWQNGKEVAVLTKREAFSLYLYTISPLVETFPA